MKKSIQLILILHLIAFCPIKAQNLSAEEKKIISQVEKNHAEAMVLLEKVVNINSGTLNKEGVKTVGSIFKTEFEKIGMETRWIDMPESMNRAGHLFAETKGTKGKRMLLIGHLDTVFELDSPLQKMIKKGDSIYAPGGNDMKGGDIIILYALRALQESGLLKDTRIIVALHGDEESTGKPQEISRKDLIEAAKRSDLALAFETSTGFDYATIARRGSSSWTLKVKGKRAHSAGIFNESVGAGAIYEAARILNAFYTELKQENLTYNPGIMGGGSSVDYQEKDASMEVNGKTNIVAEEVMVKGDLRFISEEQKTQTREKMKAIVSKNLPNTTAEITFSDGYPAMPPTEGNMALLKILSKASEDLGQGSVKAYDPGKRGAGDISFVAPYISGLDGLGAMGTGAHSNYETVDLSTFEALTKRAAILIYRLSQLD